MKKILVLLFLLICSISKINAYENEYFNIDIPDDFKLIQSDNNIYKWSKDNDYIAVTINNNESNYNIKKYSETDINNFKTHLQDSFNTQLKDYNIIVDVNNINKIELNDTSVLSYNIYWPTKDIIKYDMYQKGLTYTTKNYIISIIYNSENEINDDNIIYTNIKNNFSIKDEYFKETILNNNHSFNYLIPISIIIILGIVYLYIKKLKA